jgi:hypothetical protein
VSTVGVVHECVHQSLTLKRFTCIILTSYATMCGSIKKCTHPQCNFAAAIITHSSALQLLSRPCFAVIYALFTSKRALHVQIATNSLLHDEEISSVTHCLLLHSFVQHSSSSIAHLVKLVNTAYTIITKD